MNRQDNRLNVYIIVISMLCLLSSICNTIGLQEHYLISALISSIMLIVIFLMLIKYSKSSKSPVVRRRFLEVGKILEKDNSKIVNVDMIGTIQNIIKNDSSLILGDFNKEINLIMETGVVTDKTSTAVKDSLNAYYWEFSHAGQILTVENVNKDCHVRYKICISTFTSISYDSIKFTGLNDKEISNLCKFLSDISGTEVELEFIGKNSKYFSPCNSEEFREKYEKHLQLEVKDDEK